MKFYALIAAVIGLASTAGFVAFSQGTLGRPPRHDAFLEVFDQDDDGEISASEIEAAPDQLRQRDTDGDGVLSRAELPRGPRPRHDDGERNSPLPRRDDESDVPSRRARTTTPNELTDAELAQAERGTVFFRGGYDTEGEDNGRPVALIAAALGVETQVFRDAFSKVNPSSFGPPSPMRARANKTVLMEALAKHGITNDRLDEVSNYYRYQPGAGNLWNHTPAQATVVMTDGEVTSLKITNPGSGYMSAPEVIVAGHRKLNVKATIEYSTEFELNGRITKLEIQ